MKVRELVALLEQGDQDAEVEAQGCDGWPPNPVDGILIAAWSDEAHPAVVLHVGPA